MADQTPDQTKLKNFIASALGFWRWLVGLFPVFSVWIKKLWASPWFDKPLPKFGFPNISRATWDEIRDIGQSLPLTLLKLIICGGLVLNVTRALIETNTPARLSSDGMMRFEMAFPDREGWYWLAALWLVSITVEKVVKVVITVRAGA
jgi:hypothetical protein